MITRLHVLNKNSSPIGDFPMRKVIPFMFLLFLVAPVMAQEKTVKGNIVKMDPKKNAIWLHVAGERLDDNRYFYLNKNTKMTYDGKECKDVAALLDLLRVGVEP